MTELEKVEGNTGESLKVTKETIIVFHELRVSLYIGC